jgi:hypothetical protein
MEPSASGSKGPERSWSLLPIRPGWHGWAHFRRALFEAARPVPALAAACFWLHQYDTAPETARREADPARSLTLALAAQGLLTEPADVRLLPDRTPAVAATRHERSIVRARRGTEPSDIYLVRSRRAPDGNLLEISGVYNLSDTSAADERSLVASGERAAWAIAQGDRFHAVHLADLRGEPRPQGTEWTRNARIQNAITNYQETGQLAGVGRRWFKVDPPRERVVLALAKNDLLVDSDARRVRNTERALVRDAADGERTVREQTPKKGRPGAETETTRAASPIRCRESVSNRVSARYAADPTHRIAPTNSTAPANRYGMGGLRSSQTMPVRCRVRARNHH